LGWCLLKVAKSGSTFDGNSPLKRPKIAAQYNGMFVAIENAVMRAIAADIIG
jgi:hypothetical protein